jgi:hypothetical protein
VDQESGQLYFDCDCPFAENFFCKHMIAAALELSEFLKDEEAEFDEEEPIRSLPTQSFQNWQSKLSETLAQASLSSSSGNYTRYVALVLLARARSAYYGYGSPYQSPYFYSLTPFMIRANEWNLLGGASLGSMSSSIQISSGSRSENNYASR